MVVYPFFPLIPRARDSRQHKATDALLAVTAGTSGARLMLDDLLEFQEAEWCFWEKETRIPAPGR